jgi:uncharacterized protein (TIGR03435 family)
MLTVTAAVPAQKTTSVPRFEVVSIKRSACGPSTPGFGGDPGRITMGCVHLRDLIQQAYGGQINPLREQTVGGPPWLDTDFYDIAAKAESRVGNTLMHGPMMQAVLEERFNLKLHREIREVPVYILSLGKAGPKLRATKQGSCVPLDPDNPPERDPSQPPPPTCGRRWQTGSTIDFYGATIADLCSALDFQFDRDVIDRTGIRGMFDIHLQLPPNAPAPGSAIPDDPGPAPMPLIPGDRTAMMKYLMREMQRANQDRLVAALPQLGLKLDSGKGPTEYFIIDGIQRPTEN